jgi:hypothetical protein
MQHRYGHASRTWTSSIDMDMQHGLGRAACTEHAASTCTQQGHGHAAWIWACNMRMDMQYGHGHAHTVWT